MRLNLNTDDNQFIFHERFSDLCEELKPLVSRMALNNHFFLLSSGTTSKYPKGFALSKKALETNAMAVNSHLSLSDEDKWGLTLPYYHIGGLSIFFRANLLNHEPINLFPWDPEKIVKNIRDNKVSVISLVPTQIYDLIKHGSKCPETLKFVLVGGDFLSDELFNKVKNLGWPVIKTFGMTEVCSQLATSNLDDSALKLLPIHQVKTGDNQVLSVKSESLFTLLFQKKENWLFHFAKDLVDNDGFYPLSDIARIEGNSIYPLGRIDNSFKSSGHLMDLNSLKEELQRFMIDHDCWGKMEVIIEQDLRKGSRLCLVIQNDLPSHYPSEYQKSIYPLRIEKIIPVSKIERTDLGKFKKSSN